MRNADREQNVRRETLAVFQENILYFINLPNLQGSVNYSDHCDCFVECFPIFSSPLTRKQLNATTTSRSVSRNTTRVAVGLEQQLIYCYTILSRSICLVTFIFLPIVKRVFTRMTNRSPSNYAYILNIEPRKKQVKK